MVQQGHLAFLDTKSQTSLPGHGPAVVDSFLAKNKPRRSIDYATFFASVLLYFCSYGANGLHPCQ